MAGDEDKLEADRKKTKKIKRDINVLLSRAAVFDQVTRTAYMKAKVCGKGFTSFHFITYQLNNEVKPGVGPSPVGKLARLELPYSGAKGADNDPEKFLQ